MRIKDYVEVSDSIIKNIISQTLDIIDDLKYFELIKYEDCESGVEPTSTDTDELVAIIFSYMGNEND